MKVNKQISVFVAVACMALAGCSNGMIVAPSSALAPASTGKQLNQPGVTTLQTDQAENEAGQDEVNEVEDSNDADQVENENDSGDVAEADDAGEADAVNEPNGVDAPDAVAPGNSPVSAAQAQAIAEQANPGAKTLAVEFDIENGSNLFEVELDNGLDVKVDANTGAILTTETRDSE